MVRADVDVAFAEAYRSLGELAHSLVASGAVGGPDSDGDVATRFVEALSSVRGIEIDLLEVWKAERRQKGQP